jgi:hypothetical protein
MQRDATLIEQYLSADDELKLSMFLNHRELRRHFVNIDMATARIGRSKTAAQQETESSRPPLMGFHGLCPGWLKRYCSVR